LKKVFGERAKIGGAQGEENFCPRAIGKIALQFCVSQRLDFAQRKFGFRPIDTTILNLPPLTIFRIAVISITRSFCDEKVALSGGRVEVELFYFNRPYHYRCGNPKERSRK
jgi:hypothetical protein